MGLNERLCAAVTPIVAICRPDEYVPAPGENPGEYCTYNRAEYPRLFASGAPRRVVYLYQLHYYLKRGVNPEAKLWALKRAVLAAGFTAPSAVNASDADGQHWVLEFEGAEAWQDGDV